MLELVKLAWFSFKPAAGRMCGRRLMNINLPRSISSGCHFNVLMSWMHLGLFNMLIVATMFDVIRSINLSPLDCCFGFCFWGHFWFIILLKVHPCPTAIILYRNRKACKALLNLLMTKFFNLSQFKNNMPMCIWGRGGIGDVEMLTA